MKTRGLNPSSYFSSLLLLYYPRDARGMIQCPRGTRDFLPDEMEKRRFYENKLRHTAQTFGFREIETPIFEDAELFILRSGPNVLKELYAFKDKGDRDIALRPEMTAPAIRMFVNGMSNDPKPIKIFYFGQCFRYERPQSGRYREFFQFGAELIGSATPETDAEVICMAAAMIKQLGLKDYKIHIGHIGVLRQAIADAGVPKERTAEVLQKLDKKLYDEARPLLEEMNVDSATIDSIFTLTETVGGEEVLEKVPGDAGDYLRQVTAYMHAMGVHNFDIDLGVVRGLDYYTGMVFEAEAPALGAEKQICGGGSYTLSELFGGEKVFSTGFAIGFDRILLALEKEGQAFLQELSETDPADYGLTDWERDGSGVWHTVLTQGDRNLSIGFRPNGDQGTEIVEWQHTKSWTEDVSIGQLWDGGF